MISDLKDHKYGQGEIVYSLRILNIKSHISSHCIPGDYFAEEGVCYLPQHVFYFFQALKNFSFIVLF